MRTAVYDVPGTQKVPGVLEQHSGGDCLQHVLHHDNNLCLTSMLKPHGSQVASP